jgi:general secretion pathway protein G
MKKIYNIKFTGFTLVELMIVVAILGILAAIVIPEFQGHQLQAKEAAAKDNLRILRQAIESYAIGHNDVPPGYGNDDPINRAPSGTMFTFHLTTKGYLLAIPENPFNNLNTVKAYQNEESIPAYSTGTYGWLYHPATKDIRLDSPGTDSQGIRYYDY